MKQLVLAVFVFTVIAYAVTFSTGSVILTPTLPLTSLGTSQQVSGGVDQNGQPIFCLPGVDFAGKRVIVRQDTNQVLVSESELNGLSLTLNGFTAFACERSGVKFVAYDPVRKDLSGRPFASVFVKTWSGQLVQLLGQGTQFTAPDPRVAGSPSTSFTYYNTAGFDTVGDTVVVLVAASQPTIPGTSIQQGIETMLLRFTGTNTTPTVLFNNNTSATAFQLQSIAAFCPTVGNTYILGADPNMKTGRGVFTLQDGLIRQVKGEASLTGMFCAAGGVYLTSSLSGLLQVSAIADGGSERVVYTNVITDPQIGNASLFPKDMNMLYAISGNTLYEVSDGKLQVLKLSNQQPSGNAAWIGFTPNATLYLQNEGTFPISGNQSVAFQRAYLLVKPQLANTIAAGRPGEVVKFSGSNLSPDNNAPVLAITVNGRAVPARPSFDGNSVEVQIPADAPLGAYNGTLSVSAPGGTPIVLPVTLVVQAESSVPSITAVVKGGSFAPGILGKRMHATVFYQGGSAGTQAQAGATAAYQLGGISAKFDGSPVRLVFVDGSRQVNFIAPAVSGNRGNLVLTVNGVDSLAYPIELAERTDELFVYSDGGAQLPIVTDAGGNLISTSRRAASGSVIVGYGTGCGSGGLSDGANTPSSGVQVANPAVTLNGQTAEVQYSGLVAGFVGLCQYNIKLPAVASGIAILKIGEQLYNLPVQ